MAKDGAVTPSLLRLAPESCSAMIKTITEFDEENFKSQYQKEQFRELDAFIIVLFNVQYSEEIEKKQCMCSFLKKFTGLINIYYDQLNPGGAVRSSSSVGSAAASSPSARSIAAGEANNKPKSDSLLKAKLCEKLLEAVTTAEEMKSTHWKYKLQYILGAISRRDLELFTNWIELIKEIELKCPKEVSKCQDSFQMMSKYMNAFTKIYAKADIAPSNRIYSLIATIGYLSRNWSSKSKKHYQDFLVEFNIIADVVHWSPRSTYRVLYGEMTSLITAIDGLCRATQECFDNLKQRLESRKAAVLPSGGAVALA